jgi:hypothetical protein
VWWYSEAIIGKSVRVVPANHRRAAEFSWVLVNPSVKGSMTFMKVDMILQHTPGPSLCDDGSSSSSSGSSSSGDGDARQEQILFGDLHSSLNASAAGGVALHPFIGMPVLSAMPDANRLGILPTGFKVCAPCEAARLSRMSVLPLQGEPDKLVCLTRHPQTLFDAANLPTPI